MGEWQFISSAGGCENSTTSPAEDCQAWATRFAVELFLNPYYTLDFYYMAEPCPCNLEQATWDPGYLVDYTSSFCAESLDTTYTFGQVIMHELVVNTFISFTLLTICNHQQLTKYWNFYHVGALRLYGIRV